ncbi:unnamed protein product [Larinioides sclopetarius]|uniref:LAGLIDADG homing endonuclease n=1 Tax=Larinioides sclopetarius TaxID=280406 RepID=A0AAV2AA68_9ARAC
MNSSFFLKTVSKTNYHLLPAYLVYHSSGSEKLKVFHDYADAHKNMVYLKFPSQKAELDAIFLLKGILCSTLKEHLSMNILQGLLFHC